MTNKLQITEKLDLHYNIAAIERDTSIGKDTLRMWERRYGYPVPTRDAHGERVYTGAQLDKLRMVKRLLDAGHRPGKIVALDVTELNALSQGSQEKLPDYATDLISKLPSMVRHIREHNVELFRRELADMIVRKGLAYAVNDLIVPMTYWVGELWRRGEMEIFEEHLFTESVTVVLRNAIHSVPKSAASPKVLLTTFTQEPHSLGLLMAEAFLSLEGCTCVSMGVQTPLTDIVAAAKSQSADIVALSFSSSLSQTALMSDLQDLRAILPKSMRILAGGSHPALKRNLVEGVDVVSELQEIAEFIKDWRTAG